MSSQELATNVRKVVSNIEEIFCALDTLQQQDAIESFDYQLASVVNRTTKDYFLTGVKYKIKSFINQMSDYRIEGIDGRVQNSSMGFNLLASRLVKANLDAFIPKIKDNPTLVAALREAQVYAVKLELSMAKELEKRAVDYTSESSFTGLIHKKNVILLEGDIRDVNISSRISEIGDKQMELQRQLKAGEISHLDFTRQNELLQIDVESTCLQQEQSQLFALFNSAAAKYRAYRLVGEEPNIDKITIMNWKFDSERLAVEKSLKDYELLFKSGEISSDEFSEEKNAAENKLQSIDRKQENYNRTYDSESGPKR